MGFLYIKNMLNLIVIVLAVGLNESKCRSTIQWRYPINPLGRVIQTKSQTLTLAKSKLSSLSVQIHSYTLYEDKI